MDFDDLIPSGVPEPDNPRYLEKPFQVEISPEKKRELEDMLSRNVEAMTAGHTTRDQDMRRFQQVYQARNPTEVWGRKPILTNGSNLHIPLIATIIDQLHVRLVQSHFGVEPYVRVQPQESSDQKDAHTLEGWLWKLHQQQMKLLSGYQALLDCLIYGFGVTQTVWHQDWRRVRRGTQWRSVLRSEYPGCAYVPAQDFYTYPCLWDTESAEMVGHRVKLRMADLRRRAAVGSCPTEWVEELADRSTETAPTPEETDHGVRPMPQRHTDGWHECFDLIVALDLDGDSLEEDYCVLFERAHRKLLRLVAYPYDHGERNYHLYRPFPDGTVYGESLVAKLEDLAKELVTLHNQRIDNHTATNIVAWKVKEGSRAHEEMKNGWSPGPGDYIPVLDGSDIEALHQNAQLTNMIAEEEIVVHYMQLLAGISDIHAGQVPKGDRTAYEIESTLSEGSIKLRDIINRGVLWLTGQAKQEVMLLHQFAKDGDCFRITGELDPLAGKDLKSLWPMLDFALKGNTTTSNRELLRQQAIFLREVLKDDDLVNQTPGAWWELDRLLLQASGVDQVEQFIGPKPTGDGLGETDPRQVAEEVWNAALAEQAGQMPGPGMEGQAPQRMLPPAGMGSAASEVSGETSRG